MKEITISRILIDIFILTICAIPTIILHVWIPPYKRGFYCNDESIRYPFRQSTVSWGVLLILEMLIPIAIIIITEAYRNCNQINQSQPYKCHTKVVNRYVVCLYIFIGYYIFGGCFDQLMIAIAKVSIGRLRPHFIDICKPDILIANSCPTNEYITDYKCTNTNNYYVRDSYMSFFSGHAAFSFYAAWFTSLYLQARISRPLCSRNILLPTIQFSLFAMATAASYSRISAYKHHWSDVVFGAIFGSILGICNAVFFAEVFTKRRDINPQSIVCATSNSAEVATFNGRVRVNLIDANNTAANEHHHSLFNTELLAQKRDMSVVDGITDVGSQLYAPDHCSTPMSPNAPADMMMMQSTSSILI